MARKTSITRLLKTSRGITLVEVMIASFLLVVTFMGMASAYSRSRTQINLEEDRRRAIGVAQARLDGIRRDLSFDELADLDDTATTFVVDGTSYVVSHSVDVGDPEAQATTVSIQVSWSASVGGQSVPRSLSSTTIFARSLGWSS